MNIAIVFAGGTGQRMNTASRPKQFLEVHGKPVLIYTLEKFEYHPLIDGIILVCLSDWIEYARKLAERFHITKLKGIVPGGCTGQESIYQGVRRASELYDGDSIVLIHDGVRPLIDAETITRCIDSVQINGSAITVASAIETIFVSEGNSNQVGHILNRSICKMAKAPQCFYLKDIFAAHVRAKKDGRNDFIDSASLMQHYGHKLFTVEGPSDNIKITTPADFYIFRALLDARENLQIIGV